MDEGRYSPSSSVVQIEESNESHVPRTVQLLSKSVGRTRREFEDHLLLWLTPRWGVTVRRGLSNIKLLSKIPPWNAPVRKLRDSGSSDYLHVNGWGLDDKFGFANDDDGGTK